MTTLSHTWQKITGKHLPITMEHHMFSVVSLISAITLIIITLLNILLGFPTVAVWTFGISLVTFGLYYLSRFANRFKLAATLFSIFSYVMMAGSYLLNSGSLGPAVYGFLLTFLIIIIITPPRSQMLWFVLHSIIVISLFLIEVYRPQAITYQYGSDELERMIDLSLTYVPVLLFIYIIGVFLRKSYHNEKKLANQRLETIHAKKAELEHLNNEKDRLFSIIGHDLRSPLNSIQGFLELINDPLLGEDERKEIQIQLLELTTNTSSLLNNLLLWAANNGKPIQLKKVELQPAIAEVVQLMGPQAFKKKIRINHVKDELPAKVQANRDMLQVVLRNVISNAIKFTPPGGLVEIWCVSHDTRMQVYVRDNGIGISEKQQANLFSSRAKSTRGTQDEAGIGLGLVLCHDFMKSMEGDIRFTSTQGEGATFILTLPLAVAV